MGLFLIKMNIYSICKPEVGRIYDAQILAKSMVAPNVEGGTEIQAGVCLTTP